MNKRRIYSVGIALIVTILLLNQVNTVNPSFKDMRFEVDFWDSNSDHKIIAGFNTNSNGEILTYDAWESRQSDDEDVWLYEGLSDSEIHSSRPTDSFYADMDDMDWIVIAVQDDNGNGFDTFDADPIIHWDYGSYSGSDRATNSPTYGDGNGRAVIGIYKVTELSNGYEVQIDCYEEADGDRSNGCTSGHSDILNDFEYGYVHDSDGESGQDFIENVRFREFP